MVDHLVDKLTQKALSRRGFLASAGAVTAATMVGCGNDTTFTPPQPVTPTPAVTITDVDVLNFALNLEYLEANFYLLGATGAGLSSADSLNGGAITVRSNPKVTFSNSLYAQFAAEQAQQEIQHVRTIQATIKSLGGTPVSAPAFDYLNSFNAIAKAGGISGGTFDPFANEQSFLVGSLTFEDVGVTAYTGAANLITSKAVLSAAAGIQAAEAYHAGALRTFISGYAAATGMYTYLNMFQMIQSVRATLGGGNETTLTTGTVSTQYATPVPPVFSGPSTIVAADSTNALGYARTTDQVLHIVYGAAGTGLASGGFFPAGLNGTVKTTTA